MYNKKHISFSQISALEQSVRTWEDRYVHQKTFFETEALIQGRIFAQLIDGKKPETEDEIALMPVVEYTKLLIKPKSTEVELNCTYDAPKKAYKLLGYVDAMSTDNVITELKTGTSEWTQERAEEHGQVLFYQLMQKLITGEELDGRYVFVPLRDYQLVGQIQIFEIPYNSKKVEEIEKRLSKYIDFVENYKTRKTLKI